jgi:hypothetical protein
MSKTLSIFEKSQIYAQYRDYFVRSKEIEERQSEQRIRFFLTLVTGIAAFLGILLRENLSLHNLLVISMASSIILFLFGIFTFTRIIWSVSIIDGDIKSISAMNNLINKFDPSIMQSFKDIDVRETVNIIVFKHIKGTYAQYMYLTDGLLGAGIVFIYGAVKPLPFSYTVIIAIEIFILVFFVLFMWSLIVRRGAKRDY